MVHTHFALLNLNMYNRGSHAKQLRVHTWTQACAHMICSDYIWMQQGFIHVYMCIHMEYTRVHRYMYVFTWYTTNCKWIQFSLRHTVYAISNYLAKLFGICIVHWCPPTRKSPVHMCACVNKHNPYPCMYAYNALVPISNEKLSFQPIA